MWEDLIVAEVHRAREKLAAQYKYDIGAFFADVRRRQTSLGSRLILQRQRAEPTSGADSGRPAGAAGATPPGTAPAA
jgi:hypothetical protein